MTDHENTHELRSKLEAIIRNTQQAEVIDDERLHEHIDNLVKLQLEAGEDAVWHATRMQGLGGSDAAVAASEYLGYKHPYSTRQDIVASKLAIVPPSRGTRHTKRGRRLESMAQMLFERDMDEMGFIVKHLEDIQKSVENAQNEKHPYMRSSMDGVYLVARKDTPDETEIWIVDFKAPSEEVVSKYRKELKSLEAEMPEEGSDVVMKGLMAHENIHRVPTQKQRGAEDPSKQLSFEPYIYQLHHYDEDASSHGLEADRRVLAVLDHEYGCMQIISLDYDAQLVSNMLNAMDDLWYNYVLKGILPPAPESNEVNADVLQEETEEKLERWGTLKAVIKQLETELASLGKEISEDVEKIGDLGSGFIDVGGSRIVGKVEVDTDAIECRLNDYDLSDDEKDALRKPSKYSPAQLNRHMDRLVSLTQDLELAFQMKDAKRIGAAYLELQKVVDDVPKLNQGEIDPALAREKLVALGESPEKFFKTNLSVRHTMRKGSVELSAMKDNAKLVCPQIVSLSMKSMQNHVEDQDLEAPDMKR